jgi:hypothetical protein
MARNLIPSGIFVTCIALIKIHKKWQYENQTEIDLINLRVLIPALRHVLPGLRRYALTR